MAAITKTMAFDTPPDDATEAPDTKPEATEAPDTAPEGAEGETLSLDVFGGKEPAVGDMVTLKVTAVNDQDGTVTVSMPAAAKKMGGIAGKVAALDEEPSVTA